MSHKLLKLTVSFLLLGLTFGCDKAKNSHQIESPSSPSQTSEPTNIIEETPSIQPSVNTESIISQSQKSPKEILNLIYAKEKEIKLCDGQLDQEVSPSSSNVYALNDQEYLVEILCFMGAYQGNYEYVLYQNNGKNLTIKPLVFQSFTPDGQNKFQSINVRSLAGLMNYNTQQKTLNIYTKDRGLGDCGAMAQYQWQKDEFKLIEYKAKSECDGKFVEPENYPIIYSQSSSSYHNQNQSNPQLSHSDLINQVLNQATELTLCDDNFNPEIIKNSSNIYPVNQQEKILEIVCLNAAYQSVYQYILAIPNQANFDFQTLHLTQFRQNQAGMIMESQENLITGIANYDQNQEILSIFTKYAGHGGCGTSAKYKWQEISFELLEYKANFNCEKPISSDNWQVIYPNKN